MTATVDDHVININTRRSTNWEYFWFKINAESARADSKLIFSLKILQAIS